VSDLDSGYERDRLHGFELEIRWWLFVQIDGPHARPQRPRLGVVDRGFRFARGGRVSTAEEAENALRDAHAEARREIEFWAGQPTHALGPLGELIPLDELVPELTP